MTKAICYNRKTGELYANGKEAWTHYRDHWEPGSTTLAYSEDIEVEGFDYERLLVDVGYRLEFSRLFLLR